MKEVRTAIVVVFLIVLGTFAGFRTSTHDNPDKANPKMLFNPESRSLQNDGPGINSNNYDTDSAPYFTDNFDGANDTTALKSRGYFVWYRGTGAQGLAATWFQGNANFAAYNGPSTGYVAANFNVVTGTNNIDSWLITPSSNVSAGDSIVFFSRSPLNSTWPDSIRVMYSPAGSTTPEGSWIELGRFKVNTAGSWERKAFGAPSSGATARFAIRYCVVNGGPGGANSQYIGIDALTISTTQGPIPNNMSASAIVAPIGFVLLPFSPVIAPKATFTNSGTSAQSNIPVRLTITGPVNFNSNKIITFLGPSVSSTVTFDSTFFPVAGNYNVTAIVSLANDGNRIDDTIRSTFTAVNPHFGTSGGFSFANSISGNGAPSQPQFCWKDTAGSISLCVNSANSKPGIFTGDLDDGYWAIGKALNGKKIKLGGVEYDSFFVSTNGIVGFVRIASLTSFNPTINSFIRPAFYPLWSDMSLSVNSSYPVNRVSYKLVNPYQLLISYDRIPEFQPVGASDYVSYQVVIDLVDSGFPGSSNFIVQFADVSTGGTGTQYWSLYESDALNTHVIGIQSASGAVNSYYRVAAPYPVNPLGPMFSLNPVAIQFGSDAGRLNATCGAVVLGLQASIEAITPNLSSDSITVLLREPTAPYEIVDASKIILTATGTATFNLTKAGVGRNYYIVVKHRNAVETWSSVPVSFNAATFYSFKSSISQAYGNNMISVGGNASFYSGDVNQDGTIDGTDGSAVDNDAYGFVIGYVPTDINNDGFVDASDAFYVEKNALNFIGLIRP